MSLFIPYHLFWAILRAAVLWPTNVLERNFQGSTDWLRCSVPEQNVWRYYLLSGTYGGLALRVIPSPRQWPAMSWNTSSRALSARKDRICRPSYIKWSWNLATRHSTKRFRGRFVGIVKTSETWRPLSIVWSTNEFPPRLASKIKQDMSIRILIVKWSFSVVEQFDAFLDFPVVHTLQA